MRIAPFLCLPLLFAATPAFATGGFACRATDGSGFALSGTIGHTIASPLVGARLQLGARLLGTTGESPQLAVGRSWIDERELRVDLVDLQATRYEAQLRVRIGARGTAAGTLARDGVSHPVRCEIE